MRKFVTIKQVKLIILQTIKNKDMQMFVGSNFNKFFKIKRIFIINCKNFKKNIRGKHAHKIDEQIVTCPHGAIEFTVFDGFTKKKFIIKSPQKAIYVPKYIWTETKYLKKNTVVIVYSSQNYKEESYIRDIEQFKKLIYSRKRK